VATGDPVTGHVGRGAVEVTARRGEEAARSLREDEALRVNPGGSLHSIDAKLDQFSMVLPVARGLIGHWEFESQTDGVTPDSSGNGHSGRLEGNAAIVSDAERGKVLALSGLRSSGDGVNIDAIREIPTLLPHRGATLAAWIKRNPDSSAGYEHGYIVALGASGDAPIMTLGVSKDSRRPMGFIEGDGDADQAHVSGDTGLLDGEWTHLAVTYDRAANQAITYLNGVAQATPADISAVGDGALDWQGATIGRNPDHLERDDRFFGGRIDDVRIYDRVLSTAEIRALVSE